MIVARQALALIVLVGGILLIAQAIAYAVVQFYFTDTWPIVVWTAVGMFLVMLGALATNTRKRIRDVAELPFSSDAIWARLSDPETVAGTWRRASAEVLERDDTGHAVRWLTRAKVGKRELVLEWRADELDPPHRLFYSSRTGVQVSYLLEPAAGGTRVTRTELLRTTLLVRVLAVLSTPSHRRMVRRHFKLLQEGLAAGT